MVGDDIPGRRDTEEQGLESLNGSIRSNPAWLCCVMHQFKKGDSEAEKVVET